MPWPNTPGGPKKPDNGPRKNPWGGNANDGGQNGGNDRPPDIDELLRKAQANLRQVLPGFGAGRGHSPNQGEGRIVAIACIVMVALWLASGFYIINPGENGVIQLFGKLERTQTMEGLGYRLPWPIESITKVNVSHVRSLPIGGAAGRADAMNTDSDDGTDESLILTSDANIVDLDFVVLWNIKSAEDYLFNVDRPQNTVRKVAESAIREVVGQTKMLDIIINDNKNGATGGLAAKVRTIMQANLDDYKSGINITQVMIQKAEVHPDVQAAFQDVQSAKQDARTAENKARTYAEGIIPRAKGQAAQTILNAQAYSEAAVARATGDSKRFNSLSQSYKLGPEVTRTRLYLETMEDILTHAHTTIIDSKGTNVLPYLPSSATKESAKEMKP